MMKKRNWMGTYVTASVVALVTYGGTVMVLEREESSVIERGRSQAGVRDSDGMLRERVVVLLVSAACGASQSPGLPDTWKRIVAQQGEVADRDGRRLRVIGAAVNNGAAAGMGLLERLGGFDEVLVGIGWVNSGTMLYMFGELRGPAVLPQQPVELPPTPGPAERGVTE